MITITVNGKPVTPPSATTVAGFLSEHAINPDHVVVELNKNIIKREHYGTTPLDDGDTVEILRFVGGG